MKLSKPARKLARRYRIEDGKKFRLKDWDPADTAGLSIEKDEAKDLLAEGIERLSDLHGKLYAQDRWSLLLIFQAMDAAGKDSTIKHVFSGLNPAGCEVTSFKEPSTRGARPRLPLARRARCPSAARSASSTAPTTKRCSSCGSTRRSFSPRSSPRSSSETESGSNGSKTSTPSKSISRETAPSSASSS